MRKFFVFLSITAFSFTQPVYAAIIQGKASATVNVQTNVEGQGSVNTHIVTNVNGNTQTYDSSQSGSVHIVATGKGTTVTETLQANATPSAKQLEKPEQLVKKKVFFQTFFDTLKNFFTTMFHWL